MNKLNEPFLTIKEVASLLKLNSLTVYEYVREGKLKAIRFGRTYRIDTLSLKDFIDAHRT